MKILVADYAWRDLDIEQGIVKAAGGELVVAKTGDEGELASLATDVDGILTTWKPVTQKVIAAAPTCKSIGRYGIGLDNIDVRYATSVGIVVTNVPSYCLEEVSDHAMALLLSLARKVAFYDRMIKGGAYQLSAGLPLFRVRGRTLGLVGFGKIGKQIYRKAKAFGLNVIVYDALPNVARGFADDLEQVSFDEVLRRSDYISIHVPLTPETRHLFNLEAFRKMKPTSFVINTSRGDVIDPASLLKALDDGLIAGAGLDVLSQEPPDAQDPLVLHPKTVITPHAAFNSEESVVDLRSIAATQMVEVLSGKLPQYVVNSEVLKQPNLRVRLK